MRIERWVAGWLPQGSRVAPHTRLIHMVEDGLLERWIVGWLPEAAVSRPHPRHACLRPEHVARPALAPDLERLLLAARPGVDLRREPGYGVECGARQRGRAAVQSSSSRRRAPCCYDGCKCLSVTQLQGITCKSGT
eukprot:353064-Chlamydomonas_euryale.AAC.2